MEMQQVGVDLNDLYAQARNSPFRAELTGGFMAASFESRRFMPSLVRDISKDG
jgi:hypothetical protein